MNLNGFDDLSSSGDVRLGVVVKNFRRFESLSIAVGTGVRRAFVLGDHSSGKSSIFDALAIVRRIALGESRVEALIGEGIVPTWFRHGDISIEVAIRNDIANLDGTFSKFAYSVAVDYDGKSSSLGVCRECLSWDGRECFLRDARNVRMGGASAYPLGRDVVALPTLTDFGFGNAISTFRRLMSNMVLLRLSSAPMRDEILGNGGLDASGANFPEWFSSVMGIWPGVYGALVERMKKRDLAFEGLDVVGGPNRVRRMFARFSDSRGLLPVSCLANGEREKLLMSALEAANAYSPLVCVMDDPPDAFEDLSLDNALSFGDWSMAVVLSGDK